MGALCVASQGILCSSFPRERTILDPVVGGGIVIGRGAYRKPRWDILISTQQPTNEWVLSGLDRCRQGNQKQREWGMEGEGEGEGGRGREKEGQREGERGRERDACTNPTHVRSCNQAKEGLPQPAVSHCTYCNQTIPLVRALLPPKKSRRTRSGVISQFRRQSCCVN